MTEFGDTLLTSCVRNLNLENVKKMYELDKSLLNKTNKYGCTPLFVAFHLKKYDVACFLLEVGADVTVKNDRGNTIFDTIYWNLKNEPECREQLGSVVHKIFTDYKHTPEKKVVGEKLFPFYDTQATRSHLQSQITKLTNVVNELKKNLDILYNLAFEKY